MVAFINKLPPIDDGSPCRECGRYPCIDGTACPSPRRRAAEIIITAGASPSYDMIDFRPAPPPKRPWRQDQPRSPKPRFRKGR